MTMEKTYEVSFVFFRPFLISSKNSLPKASISYGDTTVPSSHAPPVYTAAVPQPGVPTFHGHCSPRCDTASRLRAA